MAPRERSLIFICCLEQVLYSFTRKLGSILPQRIQPIGRKFDTRDCALDVLGQNSQGIAPVFLPFHNRVHLAEELSN